MTQSFHDHPVTWRGQKAYASARVSGDRLEVSSVRIAQDLDRRGQAVDRTYSADTEGDASEAPPKVTVLAACTPEERADLFAQVRRQIGAARS